MINVWFFFLKFVYGLRVNCKQNQEDQLNCYYKNAGKKLMVKKIDGSMYLISKGIIKKK